MANRSLGIGRRVGVMLLAAVALAAALLLAATLSPPTPAQAAFPAPENGKIAFTERHPVGDGTSSSDAEIYAAAPDGSGLTNLTNAPGASDRDPAWSPDGTKIAFTSYRDRSVDVYVMDADGTGQTNLTRGLRTEEELSQHPHGPFYHQPAWSPDGTKIAFVSNRAQFGGSGGDDVYVVNADGTGLRRVTHLDGEAYNPAWSPDGTKIAFVRRDRDPTYGVSVYNIYTVDPDGSGQTNLTDNPPPDCTVNYCTKFVRSFEPAWSPDGTKIAFGVYGRTAGQDFDGIQVMDADGSNQRTLTRSSIIEESPAWSPDGEKIAFAGTDFAATDGGQRDEAIYTVDADGSDRARITDFSVTARHPDWQPVCPCPEPPDATDPTITSPKPAPGSKVRDRTPTVQATVGDERSELTEADLKLYVDGKREGFSYNSEADRLRRTTGGLSLGKHTVKIVATDGAGNTATKLWSFKVARRS